MGPSSEPQRGEPGRMAREDGQAGRLGCGPSRLERRQRWQRRHGEGAQRQRLGGQEMWKDGDTVEGTKKWGESDDEGRAKDERRGSLFP